MALAPSQPVVVITAFGSKTYHRDFVLSGATAHINKPIEARRLREVCAQALHRGRLTEQYRQVENAEERLDWITAKVEVAVYGHLRT